ELKNKKTQNEYIKKIEENHKIYRLLSNFYKKVENYEKIKKIGYQFNNSNELIIEREQFKSFIIEENKDIETIEEAEIEIISPVLKEGKYKWRGIYNGEKLILVWVIVVLKMLSLGKNIILLMERLLIVNWKSVKLLMIMEKKLKHHIE
ncbi:hypothetical protein ACM15D_001198, partial [Campylobacter jejuni]